MTALAMRAPKIDLNSHEVKWEDSAGSIRLTPKHPSQGRYVIDLFGPADIYQKHRYPFAHAVFIPFSHLRTVCNTDPDRVIGQDQISEKILAYQKKIGEEIFHLLRYRVTRLSIRDYLPSCIKIDVSIDRHTLTVRSVREERNNVAPPVDDDFHVCLFYFVGKETLRDEQYPSLPSDISAKLKPAGKGPLPKSPPCIYFRGKCLCPEDIPAPLLDIINGLNGKKPLFPVPQINKRRTDAGTLIEMPQTVGENAEYMNWVLASRFTGGATVYLGDLEAVNEIVAAYREERDPTKTMTEPRLVISIAPTGYFVGACMTRATAENPDATVYETGTPSLGLSTEIGYEVYLPRSDITGRAVIRPTASRWLKGKPNRLQQTALERWLDHLKKLFSQQTDLMLTGRSPKLP